MRRAFLVLASCAWLAACGSSSGNNNGGGDAGGGADANTPDGGGGGDAGAPDAAGFPLCNGNFAGCNTYDDQTASAAVTITFASFAYTPKCVQIRSGTKVTWSGDFSSHPLAGACGPAAVIQNASSTNAEFTFVGNGVYGYYCGFHGGTGGNGMSGAIKVVP